MEEKTLLGVGYILSIIPVLNIVGAVFLIVGWIKLGNKHNEKLWKWVGYSAILAIIASVLAIVTLMGAFGSLLLAPTTGNVEALLPTLMLSLTGLLPVVVLTIIFAILQLIGLWKAGTKFNSGLLKAGAILSIIPLLNFVGYILAAAGFLTLKEK